MRVDKLLPYLKKHKNEPIRHGKEKLTPYTEQIYLQMEKTRSESYEYRHQG